MYLLTPTLWVPRTATDTAARARSLRVRPSAWICVDRTRSSWRGTPVQRFLEARRKRLAQNHHSGGQPLRAAGHWRDHSGQSDHRDGLCDPCRLHPTRPGQAPCSANHQPRACSARRICHQQAFAGPQHLVGWRSFDVCDVISSIPTWCVSTDTWGHPQQEQIWTGPPLSPMRPLTHDSQVPKSLLSYIALFL